MPNMPKNKTISLAITEDMKEAIDNIAEKEERSSSWVVRKAIEEYIENRKVYKEN